MISTKVIADSINPHNQSIVTLELEYPRFIHSEFMTHRCLVGSTELVFDLPAGTSQSQHRKYTMTMEDFYNKWTYGAAPRKASKFKRYDISKVDSETIYTAKQLALLVGMSSSSNLRKRCRDNRLATQNPIKDRTQDHLILGSDFIKEYSEPSESRQDIRNRLSQMKIRMLNEDSNEVEHTTITDIWEVGQKETFKVTAGNLSITGTDDHLILTPAGWKELGELVVGDYVIKAALGALDPKDPNRFKKINGQWTSQWNMKVLPEVSERQGNVCANCGCSSDLEIHHIIPVHEDTSKAFDINNVVACCNDCHHNHYHKAQGWQGGNQLIGKPVRITSIEPQGIQTVYDLSVASDFHNFVANDLVVHNCFSRNAASSRAIPAKKVREQVWNNPAIPISWGKNQAGMKAETDLSSKRQWVALKLWRTAAKLACICHFAMEKIGLHKQLCNRILEPWQMMKVVVTSTEWENFIWLRNHKDAQPEIHILAAQIDSVLASSLPTKLNWGQWHLPYVENPETMDTETALKISASCCAQVSYRRLDTSVDKAARICDMLLKDERIHASPFEHQAKAVYACDKSSFKACQREGFTHKDVHHNWWSGNLKGWVQHRQLIKGHTKW